MATTEQINQVRLNIDDKLDEDFTEQEKIDYIDVHDSVNWASWQLIELLIVRLRKEVLKQDRSGIELTEWHDLEERQALLESIAKKYKDAYQDEIGNSTGKYVEIQKPIVAGGLT